MKFVDAKILALNVWSLLKPHCEICKIAGSIRREKPEVKDIEIVCLPKKEVVEVAAADMFSQPTIATVRSIKFCEIVNGLGIIEKGKVDGKYMQIHLSEHEINLDLFMPDDFDFYRQFAIRTGSADYTAKIIAGGWKKIGWCGSDLGLRLQSECASKTSPTDGKKIWKCVIAKDQQTLPPVWKSEQEFFDWIKVKWIEPKFRTL